MKSIDSIREMAAWRHEIAEVESVALVPTMGALHDGHLSLVREAGAAAGGCDRVVVTIFVNPTQFAPGEDLASYPRDREGDLSKLQAEGVDVTWFGSTEDLYPPGFETRVEVPGIASGLCGRSRPHHFGGVALVVLKLFNIVRPRRAYFGEKDYQQLVLVRRMARDLDLPVEVMGCPTAREESGLARSSRNEKLSAAGRKTATCLHRGLLAGQQAVAAGERQASRITVLAAAPILDHPAVSLEYLEVVDAVSLAPVTRVASPARLALAARVEGVRLIDNVALDPCESPTA